MKRKTLDEVSKLVDPVAANREIVGGVFSTKTIVLPENKACVKIEEDQVPIVQTSTATLIESTVDDERPNSRDWSLLMCRRLGQNRR